MPTIFSKIIAGEIPSYKVAENERFYAFLDINPLSPGHTLVVPKNETDYIFDLDGEEYSSLFLFAQKVAKGIKEAIPCKRVGIAVIGMEVPHAHIHLVPLNNESDLNFGKSRFRATPDEMSGIAALINSKIILLFNYSI